MKISLKTLNGNKILLNLNFALKENFDYQDHGLS